MADLGADANFVQHMIATFVTLPLLTLTKASHKTVQRRLEVSKSM
jgi:hypothetical protein